MKWPLCKFVLLCNLVCYSSAVYLLDPPDGDLTSLSEAAARTIESCYSDHQIVVIHENSGADVINALTTLSTASTVLINDASGLRVPIDHRRAQPLFLTTADSRSQLQQRLETFTRSGWWHVKAPLFVLDTARNCGNAERTLRTLWRAEVVTGFFLCLDDDRQVEIYTYNPYTNRAPGWAGAPQTEKRPKDWTMYRRKDRRGKDTCEYLKFDRTEVLGKAPIRMIVSRPGKETWLEPVQYNKVEQISPYYFAMIQNYKKLLKVPIEIQFVSADGSIKELRPSNQPLIDGTCDTSLLLSEFKDYSGFTISQPFWYPEIVIVTQRLGYYTPLEKICRFYGLVTLVSLTIILTITFVVVAVSDKKMRTSFAVFEMLRLLVNTGLHTRMDRIATRIFFLNIFLYFLIIHATFAGRISGFLTKDVERKNVETWEDLRHPRYKTVLTIPSMLFYIPDPEVLKKVKVVDVSTEHFNHVAQNSSIALITFSEFAVQYAMDKNLHFTTKRLGHLPFVHPIRHNWPLQERFIKSLMRIDSTGIPLYWHNRIESPIERRYKTKVARSVARNRKISLDMISFAFIFLLFGLSFATLIFLLERREGGKRMAKNDARRPKRRVAVRQRV